jgi:predicted nicotinamide N-methyase
MTAKRDEGFPRTDPTALLRYRDSLYASDLLICAVAHLDFFTFLKDSPRSLDEICVALDLATRPVDVMLTLFLARGLLKKRGPRYSVTAVARDYLVSGTPCSLVPYYASQKDRPQCGEFWEVLRTDRPAGWSSTKDGQGWLEAMKARRFADAFTAAMDSRGAFLARKLAAELDCRGYESLLDIAGGSGVYACALARANRRMTATVLERAPVDDATRRSVTSKHMAGRVDVIAGDMFKEIPRGYDVHLFANVLHDWDFKSVWRLLKMSYEAVSDGGMIAIFDAHLNKSKDGPLAVAEYSCLLMHSTVGRCYSVEEIEGMLSSAGFVGAVADGVAADRGVITAKKE